MEGDSNNKLDAQNIQAIFQTDESIIFCFDGREESLELRLLADSGLIQEILLSHPPESPSTPLVVTLPKWVTTFIFQALSEFLHNRSLSVITDTTVQLSDQMLQRLLWAGDYFQIEEFQLKCIQEVLIPRIRVQNCLLFINEAFKKLRACENSCDVWYMLLNTGMNFAAKHLLTIFNSNSAELLKTNSKILEEIIERALKYYRKKETLDCAQMIEFILTVRKLPDCFSLLALQRKNLFSKKINYQSHPSISWKLSNLSTIINKETNSFKFNDYQWKLVAKMEDDKQVGKTLRIYLRLENPATAAVVASAGRSRPKTAESEQNPKDSADGFRKIVSVYFLLRLNQEECAAGFTVKHIVLDKSPQILLLEFQAKQLLASENKRLEFTVYLNTDFVYALVLQYISKSLDQFTKLPEFGTLSEDDILAVLRSLPSTAHHQEKALSIIQLILNQKEQVVSSPIELLKLLDYNSISLNLLVQLQNSPVIRAALPLSKFVDAEVHKKRTGVSSPSWQPQQQQLPSSENKIRDSNRTENYLQGNSPFEVQKRDTEGPADADNFAMHRPESNFRQYLQRNDSQDFRKKTQSQDQFALRRNVSEDSASGSYAFNQGKNQELPSSKLDRFKKTPSNVNSSIKGSGLEFQQQQFSVSSSLSEQSTAFQASPASFQCKKENINLKSTGSAQKLQQSTPTNPQAPFAQRSQPQQFSLQQQQQQQQQLLQQQTQNQQQQLQQNAGNYSKGISLVQQPQNQIPSQQQISSQQLSQQVISSPPPQSMNRNSPPLPPSRSNQVHQFVPVDGNPLLIEREMRKRQLLPELDLRKYVLNPQLLLEQNEIFAA